jgi:hypothetical protein
MLKEEVLHFLLDLGAGSHVGGDPSFDDRLGAVMQDYPRSDLGCSLIIGPV